MADGHQQDSVHWHTRSKAPCNKEDAPLTRNKERVPSFKKRHALGLSVRVVIFLASACILFLVSLQLLAPFGQRLSEHLLRSPLDTATQLKESSSITTPGGTLYVLNDVLLNSSAATSTDADSSVDETAAAEEDTKGRQEEADAESDADRAIEAGPGVTGEVEAKAGKTAGDAMKAGKTVGDAMKEGDSTAARDGICWSSEQITGVKSGRVVVRGAGCSSCRVGHKCKLRIVITQPSHWVTLNRIPNPQTKPADSLPPRAGNQTAAMITPAVEEEEEEGDGVSSDEAWLRNDLSVLLAGPSMVHADVTCRDPPQCRRFDAVYRAWDAGDYRGIVYVGCSNLNFTPAYSAHFNRTMTHELGSWDMTVTEEEEEEGGVTEGEGVQKGLSDASPGVTQAGVTAVGGPQAGVSAVGGTRAGVSAVGGTRAGVSAVGGTQAGEEGESRRGSATVSGASRGVSWRGRRRLLAVGGDTEQAGKVEKGGGEETQVDSEEERARLPVVVSRRAPLGVNSTASQGDRRGQGEAKGLEMVQSEPLEGERRSGSEQGGVRGAARGSSYPSAVNSVSQEQERRALTIGGSGGGRGQGIFPVGHKDQQPGLNRVHQHHPMAKPLRHTLQQEMSGGRRTRKGILPMNFESQRAAAVAAAATAATAAAGAGGGGNHAAGHRGSGLDRRGGIQPVNVIRLPVRTAMLEMRAAPMLVDAEDAIAEEDDAASEKPSLVGSRTGQGEGQGQGQNTKQQQQQQQQQLRGMEQQGDDALAPSAALSELAGGDFQPGGANSGGSWWAADQRPCKAMPSVPGRWVRDNSSSDAAYRWQLFPCSPPAVSPMHWITALHARGIREINIVGDSHQRFMKVHLVYLLTGVVDPQGKYILRDTVVLQAGSDTLHAGGGGEQGEAAKLKINFYWVDGIYNNGEFGCINRGMFSSLNSTFPNISTTADVTVINGGYWAAKFCKEPTKSMEANLPKFIDWARTTVRSGSRVVLRTAAPVPNYKDHCEWCLKKFPGPASNLFLTKLNSMIRYEAARAKKGFKRKDLASLHLFDAWQIEAPQFMENCHADHHYSCYSTLNGKNVMSGMVGEATTTSLVHFLLRILPKPKRG